MIGGGRHGVSSTLMPETARSTIVPMKYLLSIVLLSAVAILGTGCTYYEVTDPTTDKTYYTTNWDRKDNKSGVIQFEDMATGKQVTLTNAEVTEIKEKQYKAATSK